MLSGRQCRAHGSLGLCTGTNWCVRLLIWAHWTRRKCFSAIKHGSVLHVLYSRFSPEHWRPPFNGLKTWIMMNNDDVWKFLLTLNDFINYDCILWLNVSCHFRVVHVRDNIKWILLWIITHTLSMSDTNTTRSCTTTPCCP